MRRPKPKAAAQAPAPTIHLIGIVNVDLVMGPLAPWPRPGTETILPQSELRVGGSAGCAGLALQALGARFRIACNIGDDMFGRWLSAAFGKAARRWPKARAATTVSVGLTHPGGERTFLTSQGHLAVMSLADILRQLPARAGKGDVALLCGTFLCPGLVDSYERLIADLVQRGFAVALDTGWPSGGWTRAIRRRVIDWLPSCDHVLLNEIESCNLAGKKDVAAAARWIVARARPGAAVVIKRGHRGASAWQNGEACEVAAPAVKVMDTIGAGDVFNAGYLHARLQGASLAGAVRKGVALASAAVSTSPRRYASA